MSHCLLGLEWDLARSLHFQKELAIRKMILEPICQDQCQCSLSHSAHSPQAGDGRPSIKPIEKITKIIIASLKIGWRLRDLLGQNWPCMRFRPQHNLIGYTDDCLIAKNRLALKVRSGIVCHFPLSRMPSPMLTAP